MVSFSAARCWVKRTGGRETSGTRTANLIALVAADRRRILERRRLGVSSPGGRWRREVQETRERPDTAERSVAQAAQGVRVDEYWSTLATPRSVRCGICGIRAGPRMRAQRIANHSAWQRRGIRRGRGRQRRDAAEPRAFNSSCAYI